MPSHLNRTVDAAFRAGQVSPRALKRLNIVPGRKTSGRMAEFDAKERDEGAGRQRGVVNSEHLESRQHQSTGTEAHAGGLPTRGGRVHGTVPRRVVDEDHIDDGRYQRPQFPPGAKTRGKVQAQPPSKPLRAQRGRIPPSGGDWYSGGGRNTQ